MFDFFCELFGELNKKSYRFQVDNGKKIVVQGYKNVLLITESRISIRLFDGELEINGKNLRIKELSQNTLIVNGKINSILTGNGDDGKQD